MKTDRTHWPSVWQFGLSALASANLWTAALGLLILGIFTTLAEQLGVSGRSGAPAAGNQPLAMLLMASGLFMIGMLVLPSAIYALGRLAGWRLPDSRALLSRLHPAFWALLLPVVLGLGYWLAASQISWLVLPPLHVLAVLLSVGWLAWVALRGLPLGSSQRLWGTLASGLALGPFLIMIFESLAALAFLVMAGIAVAGQPQLMERLARITSALQDNPASAQQSIQTLGIYLVRPTVILAVLAFGAGVVPLIEEVFKPIAVWLLVSWNLSPAAGFAAGALSGAGYAIFESMALGSSGDQWAPLLTARIGTSAVHILTAGMTGWALATAWRTRRYWLLGVTYLAAVVIHATWNTLTLVIMFDGLTQLLGRPVSLSPLYTLSRVAPMALVVLAVMVFLGIFFANRRLGGRATAQPESTEAPEAGDQA